MGAVADNRLIHYHGEAVFPKFLTGDRLMTGVTRRQKLESMLEQSPDDQLLRYMLAMEFDKESDHERSLELFHALMHQSPPYVPAFLMAGQLLARLERINDARLAYQAGIVEAEKQNNDHAAGEMTSFLQAIESGP